MFSKFLSLIKRDLFAVVAASILSFVLILSPVPADMIGLALFTIAAVAQETTGIAKPDRIIQYQGGWFLHWAPVATLLLFEMLLPLGFSTLNPLTGIWMFLTTMRAIRNS